MEEERKNCRGCIYYLVTWDKAAPMGCKYFGFKSRKMPCLVVKESTGKYCDLYISKDSVKKE